jgi:hypothetical protein
MNTGCPLSGVCLPSLRGFAAPSRFDTRSAASARTAFSPFLSRYSNSSERSRKRRRNRDFARSRKSWSMSFVAASLRAGSRSRRRLRSHPAGTLAPTEANSCATQMLTDCSIFFRAERWSAVVVEREQYLNQMHRRSPVQKRSIPNTKSSATVTAAESSSDPRQPSRFEKKKNIAGNSALGPIDWPLDVALAPPSTPRMIQSGQ